ncbi:DASS family sodium-coupled anion symporter [Rickettsiales endosymbiont of Peranema trichophorum]|uniref:DASS family sodium-coupled anion symporter n=1 Tax=Rickettsiales endosymbiont of Peranema trichophorum TaxID=2486577 RepID=UPI001022BF1E|nr:DASS family sodium-coupled anion symporter [Rickettsiales endosymbiont of Peranema trichophorum]RZI47411.1 DASS family sodium-coupled anion symporter [Rickettsiales endosymbiont of Peranema trichophorum]
MIVTTRSSQTVQILLILGVGCILWHLPCPEMLTHKAWHLFAIFITTILAIIINPLPIGATAFTSLCIANATGVLTVKEAFGAFGESMAWLVVLAFFISRGIIKTGLGRRIAYFFIAKIGQTTFGLSYGLIFTEFILAPIIPSAAARGGGVIFPIAKVLSEEYGGTHTSAAKNLTGRFIMQVCFHSNVITSAMFLTSLVANPMIQHFAKQMGIVITWTSWALGAIIPGLISLVLLPFIMYMIAPPSVSVVPDAPEIAANELKKMGRISHHELVMALVFVCMLICWVFADVIGIETITTAMVGCVILVITGVLSWNDVLHEKSAWDTLIWYAVLVVMSGYLTKLGVMEWAGANIESLISMEHVTYSIAGLILFYFYIHYMFASITAHAAVLYSTFLILLLRLGVPPMMSAMILAYFATISSGLTHFGTAAAPVFFESGYCSIKDWWRIGFIICTLNLVVWSLAGSVWWSYLGWWSN